MRDTRRIERGNSWRATAILVLVVLMLPVEIFIVRHWGLRAASVASAAAGGAAVPALSTLSRHTGHATASLDSIVIDGKPTVVAALSKRRSFNVKRSDTIQFVGWAFDPNAAAPAGGVFFRFGARDLSSSYGLTRQDVSAAYKLPNLTFVGFSALVSGRSLHEGANSVSVVVVSHDLKSYYVNPSEVVLDLH